MKVDLTKLHPSYFPAGQELSLIDVGEESFLSLEGTSPPGGEGFQRKIRAIYSVVYAVKRTCKMMDKDFVVPWLEALWWDLEPEAGVEGSGSEWR